MTNANFKTDALRLRLYCHGLGDCNLIGVPKDDGGTFWILIDCGIHTSASGGPDRVRAVVEDILKITTHLDVVVGTHEHWDHISGFTQAGDLFAKFTIGEVWFAWTENPADMQARQLDKFKGDALAALVDTALRLHADTHFGAVAHGIDALLGFNFGAKGERSRDARESLRALSPNVRHLEPGDTVPLPVAAKAIRVHVLGPPRDPALLGLQDSKTQTYAMNPLVGILRNGMAIEADQMRVKDDPLAPFEEGAGLSLSKILADKGAAADPATLAFLSEHYAGPAKVSADDQSATAPADDQRWRRIDSDWLGAGADLALQLDSRTNNTSLVLAIEIVATGKVLIFAADAQVGNWKSWAGVSFKGDAGAAIGEPLPFTGADLLKRSVFYKVGHHGSRNATLSEGGLELMVSPDLTAFIPTDEVMAKKVHWNDIPADALLTRLQTKTSGRVIQSDAAWVQQAGKPPGVTIGGSLISLNVQPSQGAAFEGAPCVDLQIG